jgi:CDK-activating kinase assembly factor MAT1
MMTEIEKDIYWRRKLKMIYNKTEADFDTPLAFRDYEEEVETLIFNLSHDIDKDAMERQIDEYRRKNLHAIQSNNVRVENELAETSRLLTETEQERDRRLRQFQEEDKAAKQQRRVQREHENANMLGVSRGYNHSHSYRLTAVPTVFDRRRCGCRRNYQLALFRCVPLDLA